MRVHSGVWRLRRKCLSGIEARFGTGLALGQVVVSTESFGLPHTSNFVQRFKHYDMKMVTNEGYAVAQLVEALGYKPENRGLDSLW